MIKIILKYYFFIVYFIKKRYITSVYTKILWLITIFTLETIYHYIKN